MTVRGVLAYHAVVPDDAPVPDPCFHTASVFRQHLRLLKRHAAIVPLAHLLAEDTAGAPVQVAITFDDGFSSNREVLLPILEDEGVPVTVFLSTAFIGTDETIWFCRVAAAIAATRLSHLDWDGEQYDLAPRRRAETSVRLQANLKRLPHPLLLDNARRVVRILGGDFDRPIDARSPFRMLDRLSIDAMRRSGLVAFGAHGHTHAILARLERERQRSDVGSSVAAIKAVTGAPCTLFAYPNGQPGDFDATTVDALRESGVTHAFTTSRGLVHLDDDPFQLPRLGISSVEEWHDFPEALRTLGVHRPGALPGARVLFAYRFCGNGGVETALLNRARALRHEGSAVELMFDEFYGMGGTEMADDPAVLVGMGRDAKLAHLRQRAHDVVSIADHPAFLASAAAATTEAAVFVETHASAPAALPRLYGHFRSPIVAGIIVPSDFNRDRVEHLAGPGLPIEVLPNAIDFRVWDDSGIDAAQGAVDIDRPIRLAWVGRLENEKNPAEFLRLVGRLLASGTAVDATMVGDTWNHDEYRAQLVDGVEPSVIARTTFHRAIPHRDMPAFYRDIARHGGCLVSTSRHESQPMVFLEAMATGCPVVSSDVGGVREVVRDGVTGWLYPPGDIDGAVRAVRAATGNSASRRRVIAAARMQTEVHHGSAVVAARFAEVISRHPARSRRQPLVSVVMIVRDGERFIGEAIDSVLAQEYPNWELIIVDDGSRDATRTIIDRYAMGDARIRATHHPDGVNRGKSASRNLGFRLARGEYVAMLDHDDTWRPSKLVEQVAIMEAYPGAGAIYGRTRYWHSWSGNAQDLDRDGESHLGVEPDTVAPPPQLVLNMLADERTIPSPCSIMLRTEVIARTEGFDEGFTDIYDDVVFFVKVFLRTPVFVAASTWDSYRQHPDNSTARAFRTGFWHPGRPNPARRRLLEWIEAHVRDTEDSSVREAVARELVPYREPASRSASEVLLDTVLDASLAVLGGEEPPTFHGAGSSEAPGPHAIADRLLQALPPVTEHSQSPWLDHWPRALPGLTRFLSQLEVGLAQPGFARAVVSMCERMVYRRWVLRVGEGCAASLELLEGDGDPMGVVIHALPVGAPAYDIQLNRHGIDVAAGVEYLLRGWVRARSPRSIGVGIAEARAPWANLGLYQEIAVGEDWAEFRLRWTAPRTGDARLHFDLGAGAPAMELRGVKLEPA